jgi:hypothetical protein
MKTGPRPKRSKGTWYVSFQTSGKHANLRATEPFPNEQEAKAFARTKLADGTRINAGTLNPHRPARIITSAKIFDWLDEPDS